MGVICDRLYAVGQSVGMKEKKSNTALVRFDYFDFSIDNVVGFSTGDN
jgi:hypothetical protein